MTCDSAKAVFNASSELVKAKNKAAKTTTTDTGPKKDINQIHNEFWAKYKV
ncbi:hypothetical protein [Ralstonia sp. NT80]|nr:hypothetical protein [Ralstonia sp. NT80]